MIPMQNDLPDLLRDFDRMRVEQTRLATDHLDVIPAQMILNHGGLPFHDPVDVIIELFHRWPDPDARITFEARTSDAPLDRLAERLGRDRSGLDAHSADEALTFDNRHALTEFGRLDRSPLTSRSTADADEIIGTRQCMGHDRGLRDGLCIERLMDEGLAKTASGPREYVPVRLQTV
jgi:hypothetical protein